MIREEDLVTVDVKLYYSGLITQTYLKDSPLLFFFFFFFFSTVQGLQNSLQEKQQQNHLLLSIKNDQHKAGTLEYILLFSLL